MTRKVISTLLMLAGALLVLPVLLGLAFVLLNEVSVAIVSPWGVLAPILGILAGLALIWAGLRLEREAERSLPASNHHAISPGFSGGPACTACRGDPFWRGFRPALVSKRG